MPRQRILHALFSSHIAGSERYCIDLANRQAALGHEVHVAGASGSPLGAALDPKVRFHGFNRFFRGMRLRLLIDALAPDICHGHLSAACKALKRVSGRHTTVATLHVGYKAHQHAWLDGLICVNRAQQSRLDDYRGLARTIPNWVPAAPRSAPRLAVRKELGLSNEVFLVGAVGRLHASKGMDVLIKAFRAGAPGWAALAIVGEGPHRAELERLCAGDPRIHLLGYRTAVYDFLGDLDLFVSPSLEESFGLAIVEAMGTGLPVISTETEGPAEFLRNHPVMLVPIGSSEALAAAIAEAARKFETTGLPRISYDLNAFDPALRIDGISNFYSQVISSRQFSRNRISAAETVTT